MKKVIPLLVLMQLSLASAGEPHHKNLSTISNNFNQHLVKAESKFQYSKEYSYSKRQRFIKQRLKNNDETLERHYRTLDKLQSDPIIISADIGMIITSGYLAYGLVASPFIGGLGTSSVMGGSAMITTGFTIAASDLAYMVDILNLDYTPEEISLILDTKLSLEEKRAFIQYLDFTVEQLNSEVSKSLDFKWYHYFFRSREPFRKVIQIKQVQINLDSINLHLIDQL